MLVASALVVATLVPVISLTVGNQRRSAVSGLQLRAQEWARRAVTGVAALPYDQLLALEHGGAPPAELAVALAEPDGFPGQLDLSVDAVQPGDAAPVLLKITARVTWSPHGKGAGQGRGALVLERLVTMPEVGLVQKLSV